MKRMLLLLLVLATVLCACGSADVPGDPNAPTQEKPHPTAEPTEAATQPPTDAPKTEQFCVTVCAPVATGINIIGGLCTAECTAVEVTGERAQSVTITPDKNLHGGYFIGQVHLTGDTALTVRELYADGSAGEAATCDAQYREMANMMTMDDYMPVFSKDSRMHFYSAILAYTLTDIVNDGLRSRAQKNITDHVAAVKAANPEAELIYLVIPSSAAVYPETLPEEYTPGEGERVLDVFTDIARASGAQVIYPLDTFIEHKNDGTGYKIYHNTDSHWSTYGAYFGVAALMEHIAQKYPAAAPRTVEEMGFYTTELWGGDALFSFGDNGGFENYSETGLSGKTEITGIDELTTLYRKQMPTSTIDEVYRGTKTVYVGGESNSGQLIEINPDGQGLPTALILRDSFGCTAYDMVNDRFSTVWWQASHNYQFPSKAVAAAEADYVIYLVSERSLLKVITESSNTMLSSYGGNQ